MSEFRIGKSSVSRRNKLWNGTKPITPVIISSVGFSQPLQEGVALVNVYIDGVPLDVDATCNIPGITIDDTVRPVLCSGTPTTTGTYANGIVLTKAGAVNSPLSCSVTVAAGAPTFTVQPSLSAGNIYEVGQTISCDPGVAPTSTSFAYQVFRRNTGTGNGTVVSGAFAQSYTTPSGDTGYQYRWRVRAFKGALYAEAYTPWTTALVNQPPGPPVYTTPPSISGNAGVGETLTIVPGVAIGASGSPTYQWMADGLDIAGATASTYVQNKATQYSLITCRESRTNTSTQVATAVTSNSVQSNPKITAAFHNNASWLSGTVMRYMTPVLVDPWYPGKGGSSKMRNTSSARIKTFDQRVDFLYVGKDHWLTPGTYIDNAISNTGGRNGIYMGFDTNGWKTQHTRASGRVSFLGIKGTHNVQPQDQIFYGGSYTAPTGNQATDIQGCYLPTRGTYANPYLVAGSIASGLNEATILSVKRLSTSQTEIKIDGTSFPVGFRVPTAQAAGKWTSYVILYNVQVSSGVTNGLNVDWNTNYEVLTYTYDSNTNIGTIIAQPSFVGDGNNAAFTPAVNAQAVANTGKCIVLSKTADNHSDGAQKNKGPGSVTRRHSNTYYGNYTAWGVDGNDAPSDNELYMSCENVRRYLGYPVQEYQAPLIYIGQSIGSTYKHESTNVYIDSLWTGVQFKQAIFPQSDYILTLPNGNQFAPWDGVGYTNWDGGVELGVPPGGDYVPSSRDVWNWAPTFTGQRNPVNGDLTGITLTQNVFSGTAPVGTEIGQLNVIHGLTNGLNDSSGRPVILNFTISGGNASKVSLGDSGLLYTTATTGASPFSITVKVSVQNSAANYGAEVSYSTSITVTPT